MIKWEFTYKGKSYSNSVQEEPTEERLKLMLQNAQETLRALEVQDDA